MQTNLFEVDREQIWEINYLKSQIKLCSDGIKNGNWSVYPENLAVRKQRLKELKEQLKIIENAIRN